jgi:ABC-type iron transport system FetAB ATPase subunit
MRLSIRELRSALAGPFTLDLSASECVALTGASGAGKSLMLRMIADLDPNEGEVRLEGCERSEMGAPDWRRQVVYSAAEPGWWAEDVARHFPGPMWEYLRRNADRIGIASGLLDGPLDRLSTGERQRLALLRALSLSPPVLLLDEPTGALDQAITLLVENLLREQLARGTAMLLVTHSPEQATRLGHRRFRVEQRQLVPA